MFKSFTVIVPVISEKEFDLRAYGAVGDGRTSNTEAFRKAIEAAAADGGRVVVPNGIWLTGPIGLLSNVELHLMDNAVILFDKNPEEYPLVMTDYEGVTRIRTRSPIYAENAENIAITGKGIINGNIDSDVGIRFKSAMGRGGVVEEIYFENILMIGIKKECLTMTMNYVLNTVSGDDPVVESTDPEDIPIFRGIELKNCICRDEDAHYVIQPMSGYPETIQDIRIIGSELGLQSI